MRNERTPRTLAECEFKVGYPECNPKREIVIDFASMVATLLACAAIGVLLAWRG